MIKYFYTDLVKGLYMAKEFKFRYLPDKDYITIYSADDGTYGVDNLSYEIESDIYSTQKHYIHQNCYEMLKPQIDDLVEFDGIIFGLVLDSDSIETCVQCDDVIYTTNTDGCTIVQRNGKAFFMPEIENE